MWDHSHFLWNERKTTGNLIICRTYDMSVFSEWFLYIEHFFWFLKILYYRKWVWGLTISQVFFLKSLTYVYSFTAMKINHDVRLKLLKLVVWALKLFIYCILFMRKSFFYSCSWRIILVLDIERVAEVAVC